MDEAFMRRLQFIVEFQLPDEKQRHKIWRRSFPEQAPTSSDLRLDFLAHHFELTGASIRNIVLMSAFLAAADSSQIERRHILQALRNENKKNRQNPYRSGGRHLPSRENLKNLSSIGCQLSGLT